MTDSEAAIKRCSSVTLTKKRLIATSYELEVVDFNVSLHIV
jgi:hypothetical protein